MQPSDLGLLPLNGYSGRFLAQELRELSLIKQRWKPEVP